MTDELKPQSIAGDKRLKILIDVYRDADYSQSKGALDRIIAHIDAWGARLAEVPAGYKLVPIEPTEDMLREGRRFLWRCGNNEATDRDAELCWSAMISAVPKPEAA
jgi:hypothetical protein